MRRQCGYTLIELIVVLIVIGILSATAISRMPGPQPYDEIGYLQQVAAAARYAQKLAVATGCPVRLRFEDASGYRLDQANDLTATACGASKFGQAGFGADIVDPATAAVPYVGTTPDDVSLTSSLGFPVQRIFDAQGLIAPDSDLSLQIGPHVLLIRRGGGQVVIQ